MQLACKIGCQPDFNPRSPHGERPDSDVVESIAQAFQSTLPARGATFNAFGKMMENYKISIHAPRTGSDGFPRRLLP